MTSVQKLEVGRTLDAAFNCWFSRKSLRLAELVGADVLGVLAVSWLTQRLTDVFPLGLCDFPRGFMAITLLTLVHVAWNYTIEWAMLMRMMRPDLRIVNQISRLWGYLALKMEIALGTLFCFCLLIVPGIGASVSWSVAPIIYLEDGLRGEDAMQRSADLVQGSFIRVAGFWLLMIIGAFTLGFILFIPVGITFPSGFRSNSWNSATSLFAAVVDGVLAPLFLAGRLVLYRRLCALETGLPIAASSVVRAG